MSGDRNTTRETGARITSDIYVPFHDVLLLVLVIILWVIDTKFHTTSPHPWLRIVKSGSRWIGAFKLPQRRAGMNRP